MNLEELHGEGVNVVGQVVFFRQRAYFLADLSKPVGGHVGEKVVLDLVVQVARQDGQDFATVEVCRTEHLSQVPFALCFVGELLLGEGFGLVREVATEDHCIGPQVSCQVGVHVGFGRGGKVGAG